MSAAGVVRNAAAGVVATVAAVASYSHQRQLALEFGQPGVIAAMLPITTDALLIVAASAMAADKADGRPVRASAWLAFGAGVAASVTANVLAAQPSTVARVISAWPAVCLLLVTELLVRGGRPSGTADGTEDGATVEEISADGSGVAVWPTTASVSEATASVTQVVDEPDPDPLVPVAAEVVGLLADARKKVTRDALAAGLRDRGHRVSTARAGELLKAVRA